MNLNVLASTNDLFLLHYVWNLCVVVLPPADILVSLSFPFSLSFSARLDWIQSEPIRSCWIVSKSPMVERSSSSAIVEVEGRFSTIHDKLQIDDDLPYLKRSSPDLTRSIWILWKLDPSLSLSLSLSLSFRFLVWKCGTGYSSIVGTIAPVASNGGKVWSQHPPIEPIHGDRIDLESPMTCNFIDYWSWLLQSIEGRSTRSHEWWSCHY